MKAAIILGTIIAIVAGAQASAGGRWCRSSPDACGRPPISAGSVSVLESDACWRGCTAQCGGNFQVCRKFERLSDCVQANDACDRACLRQCRTSGGPLLNLFD